jgi:hypothetical protein
MSALQKLYSAGESGTEVRDIVIPMGALLSRPTQESDPIGLLHTSFRGWGAAGLCVDTNTSSTSRQTFRYANSRADASGGIKYE